MLRALGNAGRWGVVCGDAIVPRVVGRDCSSWQSRNSAAEAIGSGGVRVDDVPLVISIPSILILSFLDRLLIVCAVSARVPVLHALCVRCGDRDAHNVVSFAHKVTM